MQVNTTVHTYVCETSLYNTHITIQTQKHVLGG